MLIKFFAVLGSSVAQNYVGWKYEEGINCNTDVGKAIKWYKKAARKGNCYAFANLGRIFEFGLGERNDLEKAIEYYEAAAKGGHAWTQNHLGALYLEDERPELHQRGVMWLKKSIKDNDSLYARLNLAWAYAEGRGVEKNECEAFKIIKDAAQKGLPEGQYKLGLMYIYGHGVPINEVEGLRWIGTAKKSGSLEAHAFLKDRQ